ncbi:GNAT family N-acetyltransferase [Aspergillus bombycis]|uniref:GNAT family N-acetyltransferase n=1 Tax=Aspergillus bombycis TaxID=109264 RepID=A0A1F7ZNS4_9EURO|nr:GNAT family N-acetyltransferase [Aspergillus bombycis]OGM41081.1 GNAT family N-acetyltransferase [Aspergillus bombycis]
MALPIEPQTWTKDAFLVSTDKTLLSVSAINAAFDQDFVYWTKRHPEKILTQVIEGSFCFGVYTPKPNHTGQNGEGNGVPSDGPTNAKPNVDQIGFARLITDNITFAYLTDLYILPEYQGHGLGGWLVDCVDEVLRPLPHLRWVMLRTSAEKSKQSYEKRLGMIETTHGLTTCFLPPRAIASSPSECPLSGLNRQDYRLSDEPVPLGSFREKWSKPSGLQSSHESGVRRQTLIINQFPRCAKRPAGAASYQIGPSGLLSLEASTRSTRLSRR